MDNLYKVDFIEGKNLGCIALKSIKIGTIIVQEKPVCYDGGEIESETVHCIEGKNLGFIWNSYQKMSQSDKFEYSKLYNRFKNDKISTNSKKWKDWLLERNVTGKMAEVMVEVFEIYFSNCFFDGVGIQASRFNHSCAANAEFHFKGRSEKFEIRAVSKIKAGEEITINYNPPEISMKRCKTRQELLFNGWEFDCICNLCMSEGDSHDKKYEKFAKLQQEAEVLGSDETNSWFYQMEKIKKEVTCYKEMYILAKEKNVSRGFILTKILEPGFTAATQGYLTSVDDVEGIVRNQEFKSDCDSFSRIGEKISKQLLGQEHHVTNGWKKKRYDFEAWIRESRLFRNSPN